ncbi:hypothetical protein NQ314_010342 [Rhamnusium bicolor]|uniref:cGMP-dependent protein kinase N-terminal coiled-coil domain-containing protein n=1 Tax=Rhamnusium bicolor TaxID=1586634 RepID=A0AAV8XTJ4_9CUCU|nr:hypothetical protein NQ314_010342 [Rhamnusium bicolor]
MRVCFGTLCFSSRLNAADEEAPQVLGSARPSDTIHRQNHVSKMASIEELQAQLALKEEKIQELINKLEEIDREILREERIQELQRSLQQRDREILNLRSQLDKFQSVFVVCNPASPKHGGLNNKLGLRPRKQRAGISAEPQSEESILELSKQTFPTIYKDER